jgi:hypothetical protein
MMDVVVVLVVDVFASILVVIDDDCSTNRVICFLISDEVEIHELSRTCVDV